MTPRIGVSADRRGLQDIVKLHAAFAHRSAVRRPQLEPRPLAALRREQETRPLVASRRSLLTLLLEEVATRRATLLAEWHAQETTELVRQADRGP